MGSYHLLSRMFSKIIPLLLGFLRSRHVIEPHLALMNLEWYIAIKHSITCITLVTAPRLLGSSTIAWVTVLLLNTRLAITDDKINFHVTSTVWFTLIATIVFCQVVLFLETRRHEKQIAASQQVTVEARQKFLKENRAFKLTSTVPLILVLTVFAKSCHSSVESKFSHQIRRCRICCVLFSYLCSIS